MLTYARTLGVDNIDNEYQPLDAKFMKIIEQIEYIIETDKYFQYLKNYNNVRFVNEFQGVFKNDYEKSIKDDLNYLYELLGEWIKEEKITQK